MSKTVIITLTSPGTSTGNFELRSDADSYASPFQTGISRAALITGYTSSLVPDTATIIRVQSTGTCTTYTDLSISTPATTTTTTTVPAICTNLVFGYDQFDPDGACNVINRTDYYYDGVLLHNPGTGRTCNGTVAAAGYYSDGNGLYLFNGTSLQYESQCISLEYAIDVRLKLYSSGSGGSTEMSIGYNIGDIFTNQWEGWKLLNSSTATGTYVTKGTIYVLEGRSCKIGIKRTSDGSPIAYRSSTSTTNYCGWDQVRSLTSVEIFANQTVSITADPMGGHYPNLCL